jgi:hypothetical protein
MLVSRQHTPDDTPDALGWLACHFVVQLLHDNQQRYVYADFAIGQVDQSAFS